MNKLKLPSCLIIILGSVTFSSHAKIVEGIQVNETTGCDIGFDQPEKAKCVIVDDSIIGLATKINNSNYKTFYFKEGTYYLDNPINIKSYAVDNKTPMKFAGINGQNRPVIIGNASHTTAKRRIFTATAEAFGPLEKIVKDENGKPKTVIVPLSHRYYTFENLDLRMSCPSTTNITDCGILEFTPHRALVKNTKFSSQFGFCIKHNARFTNNGGYQVAIENRYEGNQFRCQYGHVTHHKNDTTTPMNNPTDNFYINNSFEITSASNITQTNQVPTETRKGYAFVGYKEGFNNDGITGTGLAGTLFKSNTFYLYYKSMIISHVTDHYLSFVDNHITTHPSTLSKSTGALFKVGDNTDQRIIQIADRNNGALLFNNNIVNSSTGVDPIIWANNNHAGVYKIGVNNTTENGVKIKCKKDFHAATNCNNEIVTR